MLQGCRLKGWSIIVLLSPGPVTKEEVNYNQCNDIKRTRSRQALEKVHHVMLNNETKINIWEEASTVGLITTYLYNIWGYMWIQMVPTMWQELQEWQEKHLWATASIIGFWNFVAVYISFERISCILVINSYFLWILLVIFQGTIVIVENYAWLGNSYFCSYTCVNSGGYLLMLGYSYSFLFEWDLFIYIKDILYFLVRFPIFKGGS